MTLLNEQTLWLADNKKANLALGILEKLITLTK
jgi:hypothetical protein